MLRACVFLVTLLGALSSLYIFWIGFYLLVPFSILRTSGASSSSYDEYAEALRHKRAARKKAESLRKRQNTQIVMQYRQGIGLDEISNNTGRSIPSVRGILVSRRLYKRRLISG